MICESRIWLVRESPSERLPFVVVWDDVPP